MDQITQLLQSFVPAGLDASAYLLALLIFSGATVILGLIGRFVFGKHSALHSSVTSTLGILFIYALVIVIHSTGVELGFVLSPLPFIHLSGEYLSFFSFIGSDYIAISGQLLNMIILAFVVNLIDRWMPTGKKLFGWFLFRALSVILGVLAYTVVMSLLGSFLPEGLLTWAPVILLGLLVLALLVGALKFIVGALLATVNPLIAVLYTFFFASIIGKQLSKAMLTTVMISALIYALNYFGVTSIFIGLAALTAYIPLLIILAALWYVVGKLM